MTKSPLIDPYVNHKTILLQKKLKKKNLARIATQELPVQPYPGYESQTFSKSGAQIRFPQKKKGQMKEENPAIARQRQAD